MDIESRRNFLQKAAISLAALGAFGGALPAFGSSFVAQGKVLGDLESGVTVITRIREFTASTSYTATIPDQDGVDLLASKDSPGNFLNLGV